MKISKVLLVSFASMALSCSAIASAIKDKVFDVGFVEPAKVMQLKALPEVPVQPIKATIDVIKYISVNGIEIFDCGGDVELQVNSNKLAYRESNVLVSNFAKVQNQNFERMRLAF
jgi:hypothetical protein